MQRESASGLVDPRPLRAPGRSSCPRTTSRSPRTGWTSARTTGCPARRLSGAFIVWSIDGNARITPTITGHLHLNNSSGACARIKVRYRTEGGALLTTDESEQLCASDNGHHDRFVKVDDWGSDKLGEIKVQLQTLSANGTWTTAGSDIASVER